MFFNCRHPQVHTNQTLKRMTLHWMKTVLILWMTHFQARILSAQKSCSQFAIWLEKNLEFCDTSLDCICIIWELWRRFTHFQWCNWLLPINTYWRSRETRIYVITILCVPTPGYSGPTSIMCFLISGTSCSELFSYSSHTREKKMMLIAWQVAMAYLNIMDYFMPWDLPWLWKEFFLVVIMCVPITPIFSSVSFLALNLLPNVKNKIQISSFCFRYKFHVHNSSFVYGQNLSNQTPWHQRASTSNFRCFGYNHFIRTDWCSPWIKSVLDCVYNHSFDYLYLSICSNLLYGQI